MSNIILDQVNAGASNASAFVAARFSQAASYSSAAWANALNYLGMLSALVIDVNMPDVDIRYVGQEANITTDITATRPEPPTLTDIAMSLPVFPQIEDFMTFPAIEFPVSLMNSNSTELFTQLLAKLKAGGTGLGADIEQNIWDRARSRAELENAQKYTEVENYFSSRGFNLPVGAMGGRLNEIVIEIARNDSYLNNDIAVEQARLAQTNTQFILQQVAATVSDYTKNAMSVVVAYNQNVISKYVAQLDGYKTVVQKEVSRIESLLKRFAAMVEEYRVDGNIATAEMEIALKQMALRVDEAKIQAELLLKEAEIEIEKAKMKYGIQVEAIKAGGQISAQIAASALSSVNASAQYGFSAGAQEGAHASWDETKSVHSFQHTYTA